MLHFFKSKFSRIKDVFLDMVLFVENKKLIGIIKRYKDDIDLLVKKLESRGYTNVKVDIAYDDIDVYFYKDTQMYMLTKNSERIVLLKEVGFDFVELYFKNERK